MGIQSHASSDSELHSEEDGMARSEEQSGIESSSIEQVDDYYSDVDAAHESQGK